MVYRLNGLYTGAYTVNGCKVILTYMVVLTLKVSVWELFMSGYDLHNNSEPMEVMVGATVSKSASRMLRMAMQQEAEVDQMSSVLSTEATPPSSFSLSDDDDVMEFDPQQAQTYTVMTDTSNHID